MRTLGIDALPLLLHRFIRSSESISEAGIVGQRLRSLCWHTTD